VVNMCLGVDDDEANIYVLISGVSFSFNHFFYLFFLLGLNVYEDVEEEKRVEDEEREKTLDVGTLIVRYNRPT